MRNSISFLIFILFLLATTESCKTKRKATTIDLTNNMIHGLASPIKMNYDSTRLKLGDYFLNVDSIIDIKYPKDISHIIKKGEKDSIVLIPQEYTATLNTVKFFTKETDYDIPIIKSSKIKFRYLLPDPNHEYKTVALAGEINAWNPANTPLKYKDSNWETTLYLDPDKYAYQVVIDDKWQLDPNCDVKISNGIGGHNSQLLVGDVSDAPKTQLYTNEIVNDTIYLKIKGQNIRVLVLFQNHKMGFGLQNDNLRIIIPEIAKKKKRTYIRAWAYSKTDVSDEVLIPLDYGKVVTDGNQLTRADKETNILYYVMIDRFKDANKDNDHPLNDPEVSPKADFHGGDLSGITEMINKDYFKNLGVTSLWLSPIVRNPKGKYGLYSKNGRKSKFSAYHGYWPVSFTEIDERFGTSESLNSLVKAAHSKGENVFLDFVANHVHKKHPVYQANKDKNWATNLYLPDGTLNTEKWDEHRLTTWFDVFLPTLNLENPEVAEMLSDSAVFWLDKYDIDGFRHDATKHIPLSFWRLLSKKVNRESLKTGKDYYQVGETYGTPELINSYIGSGLLDGQFDFNIYDALIQTLLKDETGFSLLKEKLEQSKKYYGVHNLMGYMTGNQDKVRFMALATGDVALDEDGKYAGWSRNITKKTDRGYNKLALMHTFIMTLPGIPVIYYGDEIGMTGANDPDNRRDMKFDNLNDSEYSLLQIVSKLTHLRRNNLVFLFGDLKFLSTGKNTIMYSRSYFDKKAIILVNNSDKKQNFTIPKEYITDKSKIFTTFGNVLNGKKIELKPYSSEVLLVK